MSKFTIVIGARAHRGCFEDLAYAMRDALRALGHQVVDERNPGRLIMFGAGPIIDLGNMPKDAICFNAEQVAAFPDWRKRMEVNVDTYRDRVVWDYSAANVRALREFGLRRVVHCPVGYVDGMEVVPRGVEEDVDVFFAGSMSERRRVVLDSLSASGLKLIHLFGVYGADRDKFIARAKVCLNMHYYDRGVFEIARVSHLVANRKCVVSELGGADPEMEAENRLYTRAVPYDELVETCRALVRDADARREQAEGGYENFRQTSFAESVARALAESEVEG